MAEPGFVRFGFARTRPAVSRARGLPWLVRLSGPRLRDGEPGFTRTRPAI